MKCVQLLMTWYDVLVFPETESMDRIMHLHVNCSHEQPHHKKKHNSVASSKLKRLVTISFYYHIEFQYVPNSKDSQGWNLTC